MIDRIAAMIADLTENGLQGAAGAALIVSAIIAFFVVVIFCAMIKKGGENK